MLLKKINGITYTPTLTHTHTNTRTDAHTHTILFYDNASVIGEVRIHAPVHTFRTSTNEYVILRPTNPRPPVTNPKDVLHIFLLTGTSPSSRENPHRQPEASNQDTEKWRDLRWEEGISLNIQFKNGYWQNMTSSSENEN